MGDPGKFEFFLLRYAPDAVREEFVNIGVVMLEVGGSGFADVRFTRDWRRVRCLDADADLEMLEALERDIRGQIHETGDRELLLKKIRSGFSNLVQISSTKGVLTENPVEEMAVLSRMYLEARAGGVRQGKILSWGRQNILNAMRQSFEEAEIWELMLKNISVARYTGEGDPFRIDFGYRVGKDLKMFHAVSLKKNVEQAIALAHRYPKIAHGIARVEKAGASLTAVIDEYDGTQPQVEFALNELREYGVGVAAEEAIGEIAGRARMELSGKQA